MGRASRTRNLRSASRELDGFVEIQKPTRRSAPQASVVTATSDSENEGQNARKTKRKPAKEALGG